MQERKTVTKAIAKAADRVANRAHGNASIWFMHQPKEPKVPEKRSK